MDDMRAMIQHALSLPEPPSHVVLIGYSYGSIIASAIGGETPEVGKALKQACDLPSSCPSSCIMP